MPRGPEGSQVTLQILTTSGEQRVEIPSVEQNQLIDAEHGVAYIKLSSFQRTTHDEMSGSMWRLHRQGVQSLVLDLRSLG